MVSNIITYAIIVTQKFGVLIKVLNKVTFQGLKKIGQHHLMHIHCCSPVAE